MSEHINGSSEYHEEIRSFNSAEEVKQIVDAYFANCERKNRPLTMSGLGLALKVSRITLMRYWYKTVKSLPVEEREKIAGVISEAKWICQCFAEEYLYSGKNVTGAIFALKNNWKEWKEKNEIEVDLPTGIKVEIISNLKDEDKPEGDKNI